MKLWEYSNLHLSVNTRKQNMFYVEAWNLYVWWLTIEKIHEIVFESQCFKLKFNFKTNPLQKNHNFTGNQAFDIIVSGKLNYTLYICNIVSATLPAMCTLKFSPLRGHIAEISRGFLYHKKCFNVNNWNCLLWPCNNNNH